LVVGDSVSYSLNQLVVKRLGDISFAMKANERFVSDSLSFRLAEKLGVQTTGILSLKGMVINTDLDMRIDAVEVLGIDSLFWNMSATQKRQLKTDEAFISENIAERLHLKSGDEILVRVQNVDVIPVNAPFAQEKAPGISFRLVVKEILTDTSFSRYSLKSNQKAPYNLWIPKAVLQQRMNLKSKVNTLLVNNEKRDLTEDQLNLAFKKIWTLEDASLSLSRLEGQKGFELNSERVFIDYSISDKVIAKYNADQILTYLVNSIRHNKKETPYSFVSGVSQNMLRWKQGEDTIYKELAANEIIINQWCARDLDLHIGDSVSLEYFIIGSFRELISASKQFVVKGIEPNQGSLFQANLMPNFPGLSDAESCSDWDTGVPIDLEKIRDKDEAYWNEFKGTPKAIINIEVARQIWGNPYGSYTALRFSDFGLQKTTLTNNIMSTISPQGVGIQFVDERNKGTKAAGNSVDFGELFLSLSFFVIAAGILLLILLHSLNILSRKKEIHVLTALGFTPKKILKLFISESAISILLGGVVGSLLGILYNNLLLSGLNTIWQGAVRTHALTVHVNFATIIEGFLIGGVIAIFCVYLIVQRQIKDSVTHSLSSVNYLKSPRKYSAFLAWLSLIVGVVLVIFSIVTNQVQNAGLFLGAGALILISLLAFFNLYLQQKFAIVGIHYFSVFTLVLKNMSRKRTRTLMALTLLALGTFSVIITGANRKTFFGANELRKSGTGGFLYWVETSLPIAYNLNSKQGQDVLNFSDEPIVDSIDFIQMLTFDGDDASCLNLNLVSSPQILGVQPNAFDERKAFSFAHLLDGISIDEPWLELDKSYGENIIPTYIDQTVITWGLMKKVGDTLLYKNEVGNNLYLVIAGGLNSSVFQGSALIAEKHFRNHFPTTSGSKVMLIDATKEQQQSVSELLDFYFKDYGVDYQFSTKRLAEFNSVTNTYLDVFMMLGSLGLLIGTFGFGIVLLRNKQERRGELALLSAIGINNNQLFKIIFWEHFFILLIGLFIGSIAALIGMLPSMLSATYTVPVLFVSLILICVLASGVFSIFISARFSERNNLIEGLRNE